MALGLGLLETLYFFFCGEGGASAFFSAKEQSLMMHWGWRWDLVGLSRSEKRGIMGRGCVESNPAGKETTLS
jgi:hypothetical protein